MAISRKLFDLMSPDFTADQIPELADAIGKSLGEFQPADLEVFGDLMCAVYDHQAGEMSDDKLVELVHQMMVPPGVS